MRNFGAVRTCRAAIFALSALAFASAAFRPSAARADDDVRTARELFRQAMDDQDARHYDQALEKLRRVAAVKTTPAVHFYISYNEEKLGHLALALTDMRAAAAELVSAAGTTSTTGASDGAAKLAAFAKNELAALEPRVPHLNVQMDKSARETTLSIDGAPIASSTWPSIAVDPGAHHLVARAKDRPDDARDVTLAEGQSVAVTFADPKAGANRGAAAQANANAERDAAAGHARTWALATTAGAVVLLAGGVASYLVAGSDSSNARARCAAEVTCDPSRGAIRTFDSLALTGFIGAAALGSVAIVSWVRAGDSSSAPSSSSGAALVFGPGRAAIEGTF